MYANHEKLDIYNKNKNNNTIAKPDDTKTKPHMNCK